MQTLPGTHEGNCNLYYYPDRHDRHDGLDPYWALAGILFGDAEGHVNTTVEIDGEVWAVDLAYSDSGIAPRPQDDVEERLVEFELHIEGRDERKCHFNISPRFPDMKHYETGEAIDTAFDHVSADEGVDVQCQPANIHVDDLPQLLEECGRVVKPGGEIVLKATHAHSTGIVADPDHSLWSWTSETPSWFDPDSEYAYYCDAPLEVVSVDVVGWCRPERWWLLHYSLFMNIATAFLSNEVADELMKVPFSAGRVIATWQVTAPSGDADAT